jgi:hypothetical protein
MKLKHPKQKGEAGEAIVIAKLLYEGYAVLKPIGDNQRYDVVIDRGKKFERAQIKSNWCKTKDFVRIQVRSIRGNRTVNSTKTYKNECDVFLVYHDFTKKVFIIPMSVIAKFNSSFKLFYQKPKRGGLMADQFELR